ncbi:MAG TPA: class I SAM-dependent methyltransferase [Methanomicrobiales archaeon]|nr:class I SAM-dependent methyltransferase [Methanomicrobiales archaeon]
MSEFDNVYSGAYDLIYGDRDYEGEVGLIVRIFDTYHEGKVSSVLDLGCGTGNYTLPLARRGFEMVGVDRSPGMLKAARAKAKEAGLRIGFREGDIRDLDLGRRFDAVQMNGAVLGYQLENRDVLGALGVARRHLEKGGLLLMDYWYGPAVLTQRPGKEVKVMRGEGTQVIRTSSGTLDILRHLCHVHFNLWRIENGRLAAETEEDHTVRYFFPQEMDLFLQVTGFRALRLGSYPAIDRDPDDTTWHAITIARAA